MTLTNDDMNAEPAVPVCPQCGAEGYTPEGEPVEHDPTCSLAPVAQIQPEQPEVAEEPVPDPEPEQPAE